MPRELFDEDEVNVLINHYRRLILTGQIEDGERLPSIRELTERHGISESAASGLYEALEARGLAKRGHAYSS